MASLWQACLIQPDLLLCLLVPLGVGVPSWSTRKRWTRPAGLGELEGVSGAVEDDWWA